MTDDIDDLVPVLTVNLTANLAKWNSPGLADCQVDDYFARRFEDELNVVYGGRYDIEVTRSDDVEKYVMITPPPEPWQLLQIRAAVGRLLDELFWKIFAMRAETIRQGIDEQQSRQ